MKLCAVVWFVITATYNVTEVEHVVQLSFTIVAITYPLGHIPLPLVAKVLLLLNLQCHGILTLRGLVCLLILFRLPSSWSRTCGCFEEQLWSFQVQAVSAFSFTE